MSTTGAATGQQVKKKNVNDAGARSACCPLSIKTIFFGCWRKACSEVREWALTHAKKEGGALFIDIYRKICAPKNVAIRHADVISFGPKRTRDSSLWSRFSRCRSIGLPFHKSHVFICKRFAYLESSRRPCMTLFFVVFSPVEFRITPKAKFVDTKKWRVKQQITRAPSIISIKISVAQLINIICWWHIFLILLMFLDPVVLFNTITIRCDDFSS